MPRLAVMRHAGFAVRPLGLPKDFLAVHVEVRQDALAEVRRIGNIPGPVIVNEIPARGAPPVLH